MAALFRGVFQIFTDLLSEDLGIAAIRRVARASAQTRQQAAALFLVVAIAAPQHGNDERLDVRAGLVACTEPVGEGGFVFPRQEQRGEDQVRHAPGERLDGVLGGVARHDLRVKSVLGDRRDF